jgi:hypothetical protein
MLERGLGPEVAVRVERTLEGFAVVVFAVKADLTTQQLSELVLPLLARHVCRSNRVYELDRGSARRPF